MNEIILDVKNMGIKFGKRHILEGVNLNVRRNELVSVLGISGSGKTTLFHLIAGMISPDTGEITRKADLGYMMQKDLLMPWKTVIENISLPLILKGEKKDAAYRKAKAYFDQFGLSGTEKLFPNALSGGMRQRAALLRTYLQSGQMFLLDEPFSSVDAITRHQLHRWILKIKKDLDLSILLVTHDVEEAVKLSDRIYILAGSPASIAKEIYLGANLGDEVSEEEHKFRIHKARDEIYKLLEQEISSV